jgi:hypothetical protein
MVMSTPCPNANDVSSTNVNTFIMLLLLTKHEPQRECISSGGFRRA